MEEEVINYQIEEVNDVEEVYSANNLSRSAVKNQSQKI